MYRALYNFGGKDAGSLSFQKGDKFTLMDCSKDEHWWEVVDVHGQAGYVPVQYLEKDQSVTLAQDDVVKSIDRAIEYIHMAATNSGGSLNTEQRKNLQKLIEHRKNVLQGTNLAAQQPKRRAPSLQEGKQGGSTRRSSTKSRAAPKPPERTTPDTTPVSNTFFKPPADNRTPTPDGTPKSHMSSTRGASAENTNNVASDNLDLKALDVPSGLLSEIVDQVRNQTGLSFDKSKTAVKIVLSQIAGNVPELSTAMEAILQSSQSKEEESTNAVLEGGTDYERLEVIFTELVSCKDDSQQRSWALHEDEAIITEYLEELQTLLVDADVRVCKAVIQKDNYDYLSSLVLYYQMEHRLTIRLLLLRVFGGICGLDLGALSHLLGTILPVEIARDLKTDRENFVKMCYSSLLCVMLFSTGEQLPITHYDHLSADFVSFLMDFIEDPPYDEEAEQIPDLFINLLLSFNLHFQDPANNILMSVLAPGRPCKSFSEKIMLLVNRGVLDHTTDAPDSLLKFLLDVFSSQTTSEIFYTNDMMVLIDIVVRQLTDLSPGNQVRTKNLSLIFKIFENSSYWEHRHRLSELAAVFDRILLEEGTVSDKDKEVVNNIKTNFGQQLNS